MAAAFKKILLIIVIVLIIAGVVSFAYPYYLSLRGDNAEKKIVIHQAIDENEPFTVENKGVKIKAIVADSDAERVQGLSGTQFLNDDQGMFFVFEKPDYYGIWMKDMLFPLDIIYLDQNFIAVDIKKNVSPDTYPEIFYPKKKAKYVLEINGGISAENNFAIGDKWIIPQNGISL